MMKVNYEKYETWATRLWIDNDPYYYSMVKEAVRENRDLKQYEIEEIIEEMVVTWIQEDLERDSGLAHDLLYHAIQAIQWDWVVEEYLEEIEYEETIERENR